MLDVPKLEKKISIKMMKKWTKCKKILKLE